LQSNLKQENMDKLKINHLLLKGEVSLLNSQKNNLKTGKSIISRLLKQKKISQADYISVSSAINCATSRINIEIRKACVLRDDAFSQLKNKKIK
jgi:hypothetical protein